MMKKRNTKSALISAILALAVCFTALAGTTFAWFTDSVTSANNIIVSGNLDVELYHTNNYITAREKVGGLTDLFTVEEGKTFLWEPGAVVWENFEVANEGSLALKYQLLLNFTNATETAAGSGKTLADVLKVAVVAGGFNGTRAEAQALSYNYTLATFALEGQLVAGAASDVYGVVIYWAPSAIDNNYNVAGGLSIDLGVKLFATQLANEADSFDPDYDANASLPSVPGSTAANIKADGSASVEVNKAPSANTETTVIDAPAGAFNATDKVEVVVATDNSLFDVSAAGGVVATLDITMTVNGTESSADLNDGKYTVTTYISKGLANVKVTYTGTDGKSQPTDVTYDAVTGKLTFKTSHFSEYAVSGEALAYDVVNDVAFATIEKVVASSKVENNTVVIPEVNQEVIVKEIEKLPEEEKQAAIVATAAAQIGETAYATFAEAFAAAKSGDTIVLLNNVALGAGCNVTVASGKAITLDLNGKNVLGIDNTTASFGLINVGAGATLTIEGEGKITLSATTNNGWSRYSSVISNQRGTLIVNGGTIEHLGGTDMSYAIDNLTNTGAEPAKTVINGGTVQSTYIGIRQFCNAATGLNELEINGGAVIGVRRSVWMQQPNSIVNLAKLTINDGTLYGDLTIGADNFEVAIAGGYFTDLQSALKYAVDGATIGLAGDATIDMNETFTIANGFDLVIDLNGYSVTSTADKSGNQELFLVKGNLTVKNGSLAYTALNNQGWNAMITIFDVTAGGVLNLDGVEATVAGSDMNFIVHLNNWGSATLNVTDCDFTATYVAVRVFNSGYDMNTVSIKDSTLSTTGNSAFWVHNYTAADFGTQEKADAQAKLLNFTFENVKFEAKKAAFRYGMTNAEYYTADGAQVVSTAAALQSALDNGDNVVLYDDVLVANSETGSNGYGKTGISILNGSTFDGNGNSVGVNAWGTWDTAINTTGGTIKNLTVNNGMRGIFINHNGTAAGKVYLENVIINGTIYTISCDQGTNNGLEAVNCTFNGWTSYAATLGAAKFENCSFGEGQGYAFCRPYSSTEFVGCDFAAGFQLDACAAVTFENCTIGGVALTAENLATLVVGGINNVTVK